MTSLSVEEALLNLPDEPGVYLIKDARRKVVYVGKAKSLKKRVPAHFKEDTPKSVGISSRAAFIQTIATNSEHESTILESNLIKLHKPPFNTVGKDGKSYPFIEITVSEEFPRVRIIREANQSAGSKLLGPFPSGMALRRTVDYGVRIFRIADCAYDIQKIRERKWINCMRLRTKRCVAPCINHVNADDYQERVREFVMFIGGEQETLIEELQARMAAKSGELRYEEAAEIRDQLDAIGKTLRTQSVSNLKLKDCDVIGFCKQGRAIAAELLSIREKKLWGGDSLVLSFSEDLDDGEIGITVLREFYINRRHQVGTVIVPAQYRQDPKIAGLKLQIRLQQTHKELLRMAYFNARIELRRTLRGTITEDQIQKGLEQIAELVDLSGPPSRIHGFDISTIQGTNSVGSSVCFVWGKPFKNQYRRYRIRSKAAQQDDFRAMREVVHRRYDGMADDSEDLPDLIVIDGGPGQLEFAHASLSKTGLSIPIISLAKKEELIYFVDREEPARLPIDSPALRVLMAVRDESHRFAISYHRLLRKKSALRSILDEIPGIGKKRKNILLSHFGSTANIAVAGLDEISAVEGIPENVAKAVYGSFHKDE